MINIRNHLWLLSLLAPKCLAVASVGTGSQQALALSQSMEETIDYGDNFRKAHIEGSEDSFNKEFEAGEVERQLQKDNVLHDVTHLFAGLKGTPAETLDNATHPFDDIEVPPTATPTESPAPSPSPSASPTELPTESPAPSPSPSEAPTETPTGTESPTNPPTSEPTESPAPSPSPSEPPTEGPTTSPSASPTNGPTITYRPTTSPSDQPTEIPSVSPSSLPSMLPSESLQPTRPPSDAPSRLPSLEPSEAPTDFPSESLQPSSGPTTTPSSVPTSVPSYTPTGYPTTSPSLGPTDVPSAGPTNYPTADPTTGFPSLLPSDMPSLVPSNMPSPWPTLESIKAKTAMVTVLLVGITEEMENFPLAKFEVQTLEFVRATMPDPEGFEMQVLAVTVLTQTVITGDNSTEGDGRRVLAEEEGAKSLKVSFRVVGVVSSGVAPDDYNFSTLFGYGFRHHFTEYLQRLSSVDPLFAKLVQSKSGGHSNFASDRRRFIATIVCSAIVFFFAVFASYYAIKKHLASRRRGKDLVLALPDSNYVTHSSSSSLNHPKLGENNSLQLEIDASPPEDDDDPANPSPMMSALKACLEGDEAMFRMQLSPTSPNTMEKGGNRRKSPFSGLGERNGGIRKWLTPRRESFGRNVFNVEQQNSARSGRADPPERSRVSDVPAHTGASPVDPDARKASTADAPTRFSNGGNHTESSPQKSTLSSHNLSSHNRKGPGVSQHNRSMFSRTPQGSAVGSAANSFFMKVGSVFGKTRTPKSEAAYSDAPRSFAGASEPGQKSFSRNGSEAGASDFEGRKAFPASEPGFNVSSSYDTRREGSKEYDVSYTEHSRGSRTRPPRNNDFADHLKPPRSESRTSRHNRADEREEDIDPTSSEVGLNAYAEELDDRKRGGGGHKRANSDMDGRNRTRTMDSEQEDMYGEAMSEIRLTESIGGTLGARVDYEAAEPYIPEPYEFPSRSQSSNINYHDNRHHPASSPEPSPKWDDTVKPFTLGARPLGGGETQQQNQYREMPSFEGSYDVFAPSGPIGIVVDTTKNGPAVHSLKSTSPMLGLINPGDLIVALDDEHTRDMTAATLTKLMAKRSRQKERKITLIAMDDY